MLKVNQDASIAVRVQRDNGTTYDVPGKVHNRDQGTGEWWWSWPEKGTEELDRKHAKA